MSTPFETPESQDIIFTLSAAEKVASLIADEDNPNLNLRVAINGGGCSGFQYAFSFDDSIQDDDAVITQHCSDGTAVKLLVDSISYQYLDKAEIDYVSSIQGEQFVIRNPNAKTTCKTKRAIAIRAPVLPALTQASTRPSFTRLMATLMDESFLFRIACEGSSSISTTSDA